MNDATKISPDMIDTGPGQWYDSFGRVEREVSAKLFVRACQKAGGWTVTQDQLDTEDSTGRYVFNGLGKEPWIIRHEDGTFTATHRFICHVYGMFPAGG